MAAPAPQPADATDARLQAKLGNVKKQSATVVAGRKQERAIFDDKFMKPDATLYIGNCENCDFVINTVFTKVLVESCKNTRVTFNGQVLTNIVVIWKCEDVISLINTRISTIQADMCRKLSLQFTKKELYASLVWAGVHELSLTFRDSPEHRLETGFAQMQAIHKDLSEQTDQFIVRFVQERLVQEQIVRLANGYPTTEREAAVFDANQKVKEEHMRREAEKLLKLVPKKYLKEQEVDKVGRNDKCPCGSGSKYKACHGKKETAKDADKPAEAKQPEPAKAEPGKENATAAAAAPVVAAKDKRTEEARPSAGDAAPAPTVEVPK